MTAHNPLKVVPDLGSAGFLFCETCRPRRRPHHEQGVHLNHALSLAALLYYDAEHTAEVTRAFDAGYQAEPGAHVIKAFQFGVDSGNWYVYCDTCDQEDRAITESVRIDGRHPMPSDLSAFAETHQQDLDANPDDPACDDDEPGDREVLSIHEHGEEAAFGRDFYRCSNTGEWVYKWIDERQALARHQDRPRMSTDVLERWEEILADYRKGRGISPDGIVLEHHLQEARKAILACNRITVENLPLILSGGPCFPFPLDTPGVACQMFRIVDEPEAEPEVVDEGGWISIDHSMPGFTEGKLYQVERRGITQQGMGYQVLDDHGYTRFVPDGACSKEIRPNQQNGMIICEECRADISPFDDGEPGRHDTTCSHYPWGVDEEGKPTWLRLARGDGGWSEDEVLPIIGWAYQGLPVILTNGATNGYQTLALCPGTWRPWQLADRTYNVELTQWDIDAWMQNRTPPTPLGRRFEHAIRSAQHKDDI